MIFFWDDKSFSQWLPKLSVGERGAAESLQLIVKFRNSHDFIIAQTKEAHRILHDVIEILQNIVI